MQETTAKKIAVIYEKQQAFLTASGDYYGYKENGQGVKCFKLNGEEKKWLLLSLQIKTIPEANLVHWMPAAREALPGKEIDYPGLKQREREM